CWLASKQLTTPHFPWLWMLLGSNKPNSSVCGVVARNVAKKRAAGDSQFLTAPFCTVRLCDVVWQCDARLWRTCIH
ncbi:MAG: hypothetical protein MK179_23395, partial [Pirellulaceae bacterium]|nr:hypothetical protein [Pirellulaceae bacterium]